jgi:hypothetical protein
MRRTSSISSTYTSDVKRSFALMDVTRHHPPMPSITTSPSVLIRAARGSDGLALIRLAALDSSDVPAGELLVAEADDVIVAARSLRTGETIADPFRPTVDVLALLAVRARAFASAPARRGVAGRLGLRAGRMASHTA